MGALTLAFHKEPVNPSRMPLTISSGLRIRSTFPRRSSRPPTADALASSPVYSIGVLGTELAAVPTAIAASSRVPNTSPSMNEIPSWTLYTSCPPALATTTAIIFIASTSHTRSPATTDVPLGTSQRTSRPFMGAKILDLSSSTSNWCQGCSFPT